MDIKQWIDVINDLNKQMLDKRQAGLPYWRLALYRQRVLDYLASVEYQ